jgi:alkanesulfonate monooxygenase SsuD/methylene tetrahydromethanopterin reductase-like flavin-dependent oxidoreductase (luciferase family)
VATPKVGVVREVVVTDTDDEALTATCAAHRDWCQSIMKLWHDYDDHTYDDFFASEPSIQGETILYGTPTRVREQMARLLERSGCNDVICAFAWGNLPHAQALRSLRLFAEEVMPAFAGSAASLA